MCEGIQDSQGGSGSINTGPTSDPSRIPGASQSAEHPCEPHVQRIEEQTCIKCPTFHMFSWERWPAL